ncbi:MAG: DUF362 domain-containing protein [Firmicutes bacterium]|nr:DUF362 domain-containing protein [Bacillota bacterium]
MRAEVFYADSRAKSGENLLDKVGRLFDRAGFAPLIRPKDLVAVKIHFGERGNTAYIRPQFARKVVEKIKEAGGRPFLTDANTLYVGSRANAVDHLETALENGFAYATVGAPLIIADGLWGRDFVTVEINQKHFREAKVASAAYYADALMVLTHFKGHEMTGFGGALKNIGMGLGSRAAKQAMHSDALPTVNPEKCIACGRCTRWCPAGAIRVEEVAVIDQGRCLGCGECTIMCREEAIAINWKTTPDAVQEKIVEYAYAVLKNKEGKVGFITFLTDISPECDCWSYNDAPIVQNIGILASKDPVALDQACVDLVNALPTLPGCKIDLPAGADKFRGLYPGIDWTVQLSYGEKIGLGTRDYRLIRV